MEVIWSNKVDDLLQIGRNLENVGVRNWALARYQALAILDYFSIYKIGVLGGDVYEKNNDIIQSNYDNWFCDSLPNESKDAFQQRSIAKARKYIEEYPDDKQNIYFVLVPDV